MPTWLTPRAITIFFIKIAIFLAIFTYPTSAKAIEIAQNELNHVVVINQTRGDSCCDPGSTVALQQQIDTAIEQNLPTWFSLRYDVLTNDEFLQPLLQAKNAHPDLIQLGFFFEIIPELAEASQVTYTGDVTNWYQAHHAYLIGYSAEERTALIDTAMTTFQQKIGAYPDLTTAWMIDTPSLNYLSEMYSIQVHQITREQWGTDSYHLYGGPAHFPYPASDNWLFVPDYQRKNGPLIVRQTVTDPVYNYGDATNAFTSQPNDYSLDGKGFDYFEKLFNQATNLSESIIQSPRGFTLLGLENSMASIYQAEYRRQLEYLGELKRTKQITLPDIETLASYWKQQPVTIYSGQDLVSQTDHLSWWITSPNYRLRLRYDGTNLSISDMRLYHPEFTDPYQNYTAQNQGYWIMPYLLDGSLWYEKPDTQKTAKNALQTGTLASFNPTPQKDLTTTTPALVLPQPSNNPEFSVENTTITYQSQDFGPITITFNENQVRLTTSTEAEPNITLENQASLPPNVEVVQNNAKNIEIYQKYTKNDQKLLKSIISCQNISCDITFEANGQLLAPYREAHYPQLFPESIPRPIDPNLAIVYLQNQFAIIAGRNPNQIVLVAKDQQGYPTTLNQKPSIDLSNCQNVSVGQSTDPHNDTIQFFDFSSEQPQSCTVTLSASQSEDPNTTITFQEKIFLAPNCQTAIGSCLRRPDFMAWWIRTKIEDKIRKWTQDEQQT